MKKHVHVEVDFDRVLFGRVVRQHREDVGLTQSEVAELCGLSNSFISSVERGSEDVLTVRTLVLLVNVLEIRVWNHALWYTKSSSVKEVFKEK